MDTAVAKIDDKFSQHETLYADMTCFDSS